jgi:signal transduction histidine kinase
MTRASLATEQTVPADDMVVAPSGHGVLAVLVGPFAPRTWLAASSLVVSLVTGLIAFVAITVLVVTGIGLLLAAALVGVILLVATLHLTMYLARWDRARIRTFFGVEIAPPTLPQRAPGQSFFSWQRSWVTSRAMWKPCGYQLVRGPIMVAAATWSVALALIALPVYIRPTVPGGTNWWFGAGTPPPSAVAGLCAAGVVLLFVAPWVTRALARIDVTLARVLLGPTRRDRLATEVTRLSVSRARVVDATDAEQRRIERDLHDGVQPRLASLAITLGRAQAKFEADPDKAIPTAYLVSASTDNGNRSVGVRTDSASDWHIVVDSSNGDGPCSTPPDRRHPTQRVSVGAPGHAGGQPPGEVNRWRTGG